MLCLLKFFLPLSYEITSANIIQALHKKVIILNFEKMDLLGKNTLSVVIPTFNEEGNIALLYSKLMEALAPLELTALELIFVDDGSSCVYSSPPLQVICREVGSAPAASDPCIGPVGTEMAQRPRKFAMCVNGPTDKT